MFGLRGVTHMLGGRDIENEGPSNFTHSKSVVTGKGGKGTSKTQGVEMGGRVQGVFRGSFISGVLPRKKGKGYNKGSGVHGHGEPTEGPKQWPWVKEVRGRRSTARPAPQPPGRHARTETNDTQSTRHIINTDAPLVPFPPLFKTALS